MSEIMIPLYLMGSHFTQNKILPVYGLCGPK